MNIPQSQLETWSNPGALTTSADAYQRVRNVLLAAGSPVTNSNADIFLQGSYANATNIHGDSDVDIVVQYAANIYHYDLSGLSPSEQQLHRLSIPDATYRWPDWNRDVLKALRAGFGASVVPGNKAIKVHLGIGRLTADVVPALQFRKYATFSNNPSIDTAHWGVQFFDAAGSAIVNYPKYHIANGEAKNHASRTAGQYKATVRIFKNLRNYMVAHGLMADGMAPSYCIECALHNAPDNLFVGRYTDTVPAIINYLLNVSFGDLMCQNGMVPLIGTGSTQWSQENFTAFAIALRDTWNNW